MAVKVMDISDIKLGLVLDGKVYVPVPMQPACKGCDLLDTACNGGENLICEFVDRLTGKNNMFKKFKGEMNKEKIIKAEARLAAAYKEAMNDDECDIYDPSYRRLGDVLNAVLVAMNLLHEFLKENE